MSNIINAVCECCGIETLCHVETSPEMLSICETCMAEEYDDRDFDDAGDDFSGADDEMEGLDGSDSEYHARLNAEFEEHGGYDDSMDGDHDSAMKSAGWGTDEDYGYDGYDCDFGMDG